MSSHCTPEEEKRTHGASDTHKKKEEEDPQINDSSEREIEQKNLDLQLYSMNSASGCAVHLDQAQLFILSPLVVFCFLFTPLFLSLSLSLVSTEGDLLLLSKVNRIQ